MLETWNENRNSNELDVFNLAVVQIAPHVSTIEGVNLIVDRHGWIGCFVTGSRELQNHYIERESRNKWVFLSIFSSSKVFPTDEFPEKPRLDCTWLTDHIWFQKWENLREFKLIRPTQSLRVAPCTKVTTTINTPIDALRWNERFISIIEWEVPELNYGQQSSIVIHHSVATVQWDQSRANANGPISSSLHPWTVHHQISWKHTSVEGILLINCRHP